MAGTNSKEKNIMKKYSSIENSYREKHVDRLRRAGYENIDWVAVEKIHGANFSFQCDDKGIRVASRNNFVDPSNFYSCSDVVQKYHYKIAHLRDTLHSPGVFDGDSTLIIYGELYGPGIQKGIDYGPEKDFVAFDIMIGNKFVSWNEFEGFCRAFDIPSVPLIRTFESMTEALKCENAFTSRLGISKGVQGDNITEGVILRPKNEGYVRDEKTIRPILKSKNDRWTEKSKTKKVKVPAQTHPLTPVISQYVNVNRMNAVTSKMSELTPKDFGAIIKAMCEDVIEDMVKDDDLPKEWRLLEEYKEVGKAVNKAVVPFLKKELLPKL